MVNEPLNHMVTSICAINVEMVLYGGMMVTVLDNMMVSDSMVKIGGKEVPKDLISSGVSEAKGSDPMPK